MKKCVSCSKDLPDTAMHCVFCGAKQPPAPGPIGPPQAGAQAKTVMGYSAADALKQAGINPAIAAAPQPVGRAPTGPVGGGAGVSGHGATMLAAPAPGMAGPGPAPFQPQMPQQPPAGFPPPGFPNPAASAPFQPQMPQQPPAGGNANAHAATMYAGQPPAASQPFPQQSMPQQAMPQQAPAGFPPPQQPQFAGQPQFGQPQVGGQPQFAGQPQFGGQQGGPSFGPALPGPIPPGAATLPPPSNLNFGPPQGGQFGGSATAATMFMPGNQPGPAPQAAPAPQPWSPPVAQQPAQPFAQPAAWSPPVAQQPAGMAGYNPVPVGGPQPVGMAGYNPVPVSQPPFLASQTAARMGRPIEPFDEGVRLVLLFFGALLLLSFVTPVHTGPLAFQWDAIIHAPGKAKIGPLLLVAGGVLGVLMALIPLAYVGRAALAAVLGLAPMLLSIALGGSVTWQGLLSLVGGIALVSGLLVRQEYRAAILPRILVTVGAIAFLLPLLLPVGGSVPLIGMFKAIASAPGKAKVAALLEVVPPVLAVVSLIAWLPAPSSAGAKAIAWTLLVWAIVAQYAALLLAGGIAATVKASPFLALLGAVPMVAYTAFAAYGIAALVGKQLESA